MGDILRISLGIAAALLGAASFDFASAADLPLKAPAAAFADWSGYYVGFNVGAGQDSSKTNENWLWTTNYPAGALLGVGGGPLVATAAPTSFGSNFSDRYHHSSLGVIGGLEGGYNWQKGRLVYGVEGDFTPSSQSNPVSYSAQPVAGIFPPLPNFFFIPGSTQGWNSVEKLEWLTTLRGRVGITSDSSLWYATGGLAVARIGTSYTLVSSPGFGGLATASGGFGPGTFAQWGLPGGLASAHFGTTKVGWVVGGGVETALNRLLGFGSSNWTTKIEYLFADLGTVNTVIGTGLVPVCATTCATPATGSTAFVGSTHVYEQILRVGFNYRFAAAQSALVSK
jgi:outer membrane immunogenic protein